MDVHASFLRQNSSNDFQCRSYPFSLRSSPLGILRVSPFSQVTVRQKMMSTSDFFMLVSVLSCSSFSVQKTQAMAPQTITSHAQSPATSTQFPVTSTTSSTNVIDPVSPPVGRLGPARTLSRLNLELLDSESNVNDTLPGPGPGSPSSTTSPMSLMARATVGSPRVRRNSTHESREMTPAMTMPPPNNHQRRGSEQTTTQIRPLASIAIGIPFATSVVVNADDYRPVDASIGNGIRMVQSAMERKQQRSQCLKRFATTMCSVITVGGGMGVLFGALVTR